MIEFPKTIEAAQAALGADVEVRAGGTDFQERVEAHLVRPKIVDLRDCGGLGQVEIEGATIRIGARVSLREIASHLALQASAPCLTKATGALATPEIRSAATLGGNLLQRSRCWYYRQPGSACLKSGGSECPARTGDHHYASLVDLGPCIAPHPSTVAMALLTYDAEVEVAGGGRRGLVEVYGDGSDGTRDHQLEATELLTHVEFTASEGERGGYARTIARARAEWPLVEASVRLVVEDSAITMARVALGGIAPVPLRVPAVEAALVGGDERGFESAAALALGSFPGTTDTIPMTAYKAALIAPTIVDALEDAWR